MSNYDNHYHPNSQVSEAEMDALYTVLDDEQTAIIAHAKLVGKQRTYRMPVNQHPAEIAAALDAAKASRYVATDRMNNFWHSKFFAEANNFDDVPLCAAHTEAHRLAAGVFAGQIVNHL